MGKGTTNLGMENTMSRKGIEIDTLQKMHWLVIGQQSTAIMKEISIPHGFLISG